MSSTREFGAGGRESHDSSSFYSRFPSPVWSDDDFVQKAEHITDPLLVCGDGRRMTELPDNSVALVVTSPPYFVGKLYEQKPDASSSYAEHLQLLHDVFQESKRVLEPGGRIAVNVANLGRKPYRSQSNDVIRILQDDLGFHLRGEIIWRKSAAASGNCAWGSFVSATNPVLRDLSERIIIASKGCMSRVIKPAIRKTRDLPHESTISREEFMAWTYDIWDISPESAKRVGHPAPFPIELPHRLIQLYTFKGDLVVDPFMGAGSTVLAAVKAGRRAVGYDLEDDYVRLAERRLLEYGCA